MRRLIWLVLAGSLTCTLALAGGASAAGPSPGLTHDLVAGNLQYAAVASGGWTAVEVQRQEDLHTLRAMSVKGTWGIPLVAYDGSAEGLFPDGRTLLLAQSLYQGQELRKTTRFALIDTRAMKRRGTIRLRGAFTFDAVSPSGRYLYLIEYPAPGDPSLYRVRAYDLKTARLLARIVSDKRSWETDMHGMPISRTWKDAWAYTLYSGNAQTFIHALNTRGLQAVCIDLPWKSTPQRVFEFRLRVDGDGHLVVRGPHGRALVVIDRQTFKVLSAVSNP
jgi:hypothetical protein